MAETRDLVMGTAGHIDHGKTALVRALTGIDTDRLPAEKERGITIDLGFASLDLGEIRLALVDVPGHERFVRNMLAGATGIDMALLVVAADDSVMPQTREHMEILRLLGLTSGVVAMTKCDIVDAAWQDLVEDDVRGLVAGTFLEGAPIVRTSARSGAGIEELRQAMLRVCRTARDREADAPFRLAIDRSFTIAGHGTVVTGTVASGSVGVGDELEWWPSGKRVRVRGLQRHDRSVDSIGRGMRAAVNLVGVHHTEIERGQELAAPGYLQATRVLSVEIEVSRDAPRPLRHRQRYKLHLGTAEVTATLALLAGSELGPGQNALAQFHTAKPIVAVFGQPFVIRDESPPTTLGGGRVLQPTAQRILRRDQPAQARLATLRSDTDETRLEAALANQALGTWTREALARESGLSPAQSDEGLARLRERGSIVELAVGGRRTVLASVDVVQQLEHRVLRTLARMHEARPRLSAIPRGELVASLANTGPEGLVAGLVDRLAAAQRLVVNARTVALAEFQPRLSQAESRLKEALYQAVRAGGFSPPDQSELGARAGNRAAIVPELIALLVEEGLLVEVAQGLWLDSEVEADLRRLVIERLGDPASTGLTMSGLRDLLGTTRKFAVPLGEYLDRAGVTRRAGDLRVLNRAEHTEEPRRNVPSS